MRRQRAIRLAARLAGVLAFVAASASAQEVSGLGEELEKRAAQLLVFARPDYPPEALARGATATIDVTGTVTKDGTLDFPIVEATPEQAEFQKAILAVVRYWLFAPPVSSTTCEPIPKEARVRVWFEIAEGKPKISVSQAKVPATPPELSTSWQTKFQRKSSNRRVRYPPNALNAGVEGRVDALAFIERNGTVSKVTLPPATRKSWFEAEIVRTVSTWEYEILPGFPDVPRLCVELQFNFKITG